MRITKKFKGIFSAASPYANTSSSESDTSDKAKVEIARLEQRFHSILAAEATAKGVGLSAYLATLASNQQATSANAKDYVV